MVYLPFFYAETKLVNKQTLCANVEKLCGKVENICGKNILIHAAQSHIL